MKNNRSLFIFILFALLISCQQAVVLKTYPTQRMTKKTKDIVMKPPLRRHPSQGLNVNSLPPFDISKKWGDFLKENDFSTPPKQDKPTSIIRQKNSLQGGTGRLMGKSNITSPPTQKKVTFSTPIMKVMGREEEIPPMISIQGRSSSFFLSHR